jgi:hypothetical protein
MKVVNAPTDTKKKALLEDTPSSSVYTQLQKLASQNPLPRISKILFKHKFKQYKLGFHQKKDRTARLQHPLRIFFPQV